MLTLLIGLVIGIVVGAFSHKWLAGEAVKVAPQAAAAIGVKAPPAK